MKRLSFILPFLLFCVVSSAQIQFGYISYEQVLKEMPEYAKAKQDLAALKAKYEAEAQKGEEEFQRKFVDFLQGQKDFPQTIMQKRQAELQALMDNGVAFRMKSQELIAQAEKDMMQEAQKRLNRALLEVGVELGYGYILNTRGCDGHRAQEARARRARRNYASRSCSSCTCTCSRREQTID